MFFCAINRCTLIVMILIIKVRASDLRFVSYPKFTNFLHQIKYRSAPVNKCVVASSHRGPDAGAFPDSSKKLSKLFTHFRSNVSGCTKAFSQLSNLQSHSRCHQTDKPHKCQSCYKCFADEAALLEHIPKHKESKHVKTHICPYCGKSYTQVGSLKLGFLIFLKLRLRHKTPGA